MFSVSFFSTLASSLLFVRYHEEECSRWEEWDKEHSSGYGWLMLPPLWRRSTAVEVRAGFSNSWLLLSISLLYCSSLSLSLRQVLLL